jgi:hypothetical protein
MFDETLDLQTAHELKLRLALLNTSERPKRKSDMIDVLRRHLLSERCVGFWQELSEPERQAVAETVHTWNGSFDAARFWAKYGEIPEYFRARDDWHCGLGHKKPEPSFLPLFFYGDVIPEELCRQLATFVPRPASDSLQTVPEDALPREQETERGEKSPVTVLAMEAVAFHDLSAVLQLVNDGQASVSDKTGLPGAASLRKLDGALMGGDYYSPDQDRGLERWAGGPIRPIRPFAWPLLLRTGGLAKRNGTRLELARTGSKSLGEPPHQTTKRLYDGWRTNGMLDEYRRVDQVKGQTGKGRRMTAVADRRLAVGVALTECPVGSWIQVDEFFRYIQLAGHDFDVALDLWRLYVADSNYGSLGYAGFGDFNIPQGRYILAYLFEHIATLGLVDIAYVPPPTASDPTSATTGIRTSWSSSAATTASCTSGSIRSALTAWSRATNTGRWGWISRRCWRSTRICCSPRCARSSRRSA